MAYNPRPAPRFDTRSKLDCIYYLQGYCGNGDACTFKHDPFRYAAQRNVAPVEKVQEICVFFNRGGCARGDACKFQHVKVPVEALINAPLGAVPRPLPASPGPDDLHIQLDQHAAEASPPKTSDVARRHALGRADAGDSQLHVTNGFIPLPARATVVRVLPAGAMSGLTAGQPPRMQHGRAAAAERLQLRKPEPPQLAPEPERSEKEPVIKRGRRLDEGKKKTASVFERLAGIPLQKDAASAASPAADNPRRTTLASTVQLAKKRKASNDDGDEEGELAQPERTVRVAGPSPNAAQRQATSGDDRKPVRTRLGDNTGVTSQPKVPLRSRLGKPAAGQAPLQVPSEAARGAGMITTLRPAGAARLPARAVRASDTDAAAAATPQAAAPKSTRLSSKLDTPLSDRPGRVTARAPPAVKTLQELRMERERTKQPQQQQQDEQKSEQQQTEAKRRRTDIKASEVKKPKADEAAAASAEPAASQRLRLTRQVSGFQQQDRNQPADPATVRGGIKAATPKASVHADDFDWEAGIAEDVAEADFGADVSMDHDEQAIEQEEEVEVGEDAAPAAVQQDDFAKRMAAFADAFD